MEIVSFLVAIHFILFVAYLLYKQYNAQVVLLIAGLLMILLAVPLGNQMPPLTKSSGFIGFDLFIYIKESFVSSFTRIGLIITIIGGFVTYMRKIGASEALVYVSLQPLSIFKKSPYLAAALTIPIGQVIFMCIPSASGLGLLLATSIFPVLLGLGISRISAISVITACTVFEMGPASVNTTRASELIGKNPFSYFVDDQLPLIIPLTLVMMLLYYIVNRYFDRKEGFVPEPVQQQELDVHVPLIYAILPVFPLILLLVFSSSFSTIASPVNIDTPTAMLITLFVAFFFELFRSKRIKESFASLKFFWEGMGRTFTSVLTLIVTADIFAKGIMGLGFAQSIIDGAHYYGLGAVSIGISVIIMVFATAVLTGSGSASFFSFSPVASQIAAGFGTSGIALILPMQFASSLGRASSPISGLVVMSSEIAKVSSFDLAKRNLITLSFILIFLLAYFILSV